MDVKSLIEEVLTELGNNKLLTEVSSKVQIIARLLGDDKLRRWYNSEFVVGYNNEELPDYRISRAAEIKADYLAPYGFSALHMPDQSVPIANLGPEMYNQVMTIRIKDNISSIIEYSKHPEKMLMTLSPYETALVQKVLGNVHIRSAHKVVPPSVFQTIIDNVLNRIIDMFMDLNEKVFNGELDMNSTKVQSEIRQVINNNITAGIIQTGSGFIDAKNSTIAAKIWNPSVDEVVMKLLSLVEDIENVVNIEDNQEIQGDLEEIKTELSSENPRFDFLKKSFKALIWGASVSTKTTIEELVKKALDLMM